METIAIPNVLDAVEQNVRAFLIIGGHKPGNVSCQIDTVTGTASIKHHKRYDGTTDVTIYLPALPAASRLTRVEVNRWISYFIHELCHAFFTSEAAWAAAVREGLHILVNAMEDPRIETVFNRMAIAANSTALLTSLMSWCVGNLPVDYDPNDMRNFPWLLAMAGRVELCGYDLPEARAHLAKMKPALAAFVAVIMGKLRAANDTNDVLIIARWIKAELTKNNPTKTNPTNPGEGAMVNPGKAPPKGEGETGEAAWDAETVETGEPGKGDPVERNPDAGEGDKGEGDEPGKGEGDEPGEGEGDKGEGDEPGEGEGDKGEGATDAGEGEGDNSTAERGNTSGEAPRGEGEGDIAEPPVDPLAGMEPVDLNPVSDKLREIARDEIRKATAYAEATTIEGIREAQKDAGKDLPAGTTGGAMPASEVDKLKTAALSCGKLRQHVARVLKSEENETWSRSRPSGRLDRFAYVRIAAGVTENVFMRRHIAGGYETEIIIVIDGSSSMAGRPAWASAVFAYVVAQAAQQVGVNVEVLRFVGQGRFESVKAVKASITKPIVARSFAAAGRGTGGSTPLARSIIRAAARLAIRAPGKRKMVFCVTDGDDDSGAAAVRRACQYAASRDVETVALCIDMPAMKAGFAYAVECSSKNIAEAGLGALVRVLTRNE
jgi:Mg-chelatase subunit ChlD